MRSALLFVLVSASHSFAQQRFAERTPSPLVPYEHTMQRSGDSRRISRWAVPSQGRYETGGYVGGGSIRGNSLRARGPGSATGPTKNGAFGVDYGGPHLRLGRIFLAPSANPGDGPSIARNYRTDGRQIPDIFILRPFLKACVKKRNDHAPRSGKEH